MFCLAQWDTSAARKQFFEEYAQDNGFDVRNVIAWRDQTQENIMSYKGARNVLSHHENSITKALGDLYPDLPWDSLKITSVWQQATNRRKVFESFARARGFDPSVAQNWYQQSEDDLLSFKGVNRTIFFHNNSVAKALLDLFPNIGLDKKSLFSDTWRDPAKRKQFFTRYADKKGFDSENPENWYSEIEDIIHSKDAREVASYHNNNIVNALVDLFPQVQFITAKFQTSRTWKDVNQRRKFFEKYASQAAFDPQDPEGWYAQPKKSIMSSKGAFQVIFYHKKNIATALFELFPNIGFDKARLHKIFPK